MAASTCPGGDLSVPLWRPEAGAEPICHTIKVEVFQLAPELLAGWAPPQTVAYRGMHGCRHGLCEMAGVPPPLTAAVPVHDAQPES